MSSSTRKIAEAIEEHGSFEAYLAWLDRKPSVKIPMSRPVPPPPPPPPPGRLIREGGMPTKTSFKLQPPKVMDFRIINIEELKVEVLIRRDFNARGRACVILTFFEVSANEDEFQHEKVVYFKSVEAAQKYVSEFSEEAARKFVESNLICPVPN